MAELTKEDIIAVLKQCYDPEIPVDLWNLGLIYNIAYNKETAGPCLLYTSPSPRDGLLSRMPSSA